MPKTTRVSRLLFNYIPYSLKTPSILIIYIPFLSISLNGLQVISMPLKYQFLLF